MATSSAADCTCGGNPTHMFSNKTLETSSTTTGTVRLATGGPWEERVGEEGGESDMGDEAVGSGYDTIGEGMLMGRRGSG